MRRTIAGMIFALAALPVAASADPVSTQPLAADEVLLEISALGTATSRADLATLTGSLNSRGATEAEARRDREAQVRRVTAAARRSGVTAADLTIGEAQTIFDMATTDMSMEMPPEEPADAAMDAAVDAAAEAVESAAMEATSCNVCSAQEIMLNSNVEVRLRDPDKVGELTQALQEAGVEILAGPAYSAGDQSAARRTARAQALAMARADADAYAAALGLRVVRVVRVTERMGMDLMSLALSESSSMMRGLFQQAEQAQGPDIPTVVAVGVDFALGPQ